MNCLGVHRSPLACSRTPIAGGGIVRVLPRACAPALLLLALGGTALAQSLVYTFQGSTSGFGFSVAAAGNVNGDGKPDFVVGQLNSAGVGSATVYSGATGCVIHTLSDNTVNTGFGFTVATLGDINGDGRSEIVVGAPGARDP